MSKAYNNSGIILIIITIMISFRLKLHLLFLNRDYWHDEAFQYLYSMKSVPFILNSTDVHPPLFNLISKMVTSTTHSVLGTRIFSLFISLIMVLLIFIFVEKHFDKYSAYLSLLFFSMFPTWVYYSIEFRSYIFVFMLIPLQMLFFHNYIDNNKKISFWGWIITSVLMLYTHYFIALFVLVQVYAVLCHNKDKLHKLFFPAVAVSIACVPLVIYFIKTLSKIESFWFKNITIKSLISTFSYMISPNMNTCLGVFSLVFFVLFIYLIYKSTKAKDFRLKHWVLFGQGVIPVLILFIISQFNPIYHHRYFLFGAIPLIILFSVLLVKFISTRSKNIKSKNVTFSLVCIVFLFVGVFGSLNLNFNYELRDSFVFIKNRINEDPLNNSYAIIHTSTFSQSPYKVYFYGDDVDNFLITNISTKRLFTAGGSVINYGEKITLKEAMSLNVDRVYFVSDKKIGDVVVWSGEGLFVTRKKNYFEVFIDGEKKNRN